MLKTKSKPSLRGFTPENDAGIQAQPLPVPSSDRTTRARSWSAGDLERRDGTARMGRVADTVRRECQSALWPGVPASRFSTVWAAHGSSESLSSLEMGLTGSGDRREQLACLEILLAALDREHPGVFGRLCQPHVLKQMFRLGPSSEAELVRALLRHAVTAATSALAVPVNLMNPVSRTFFVDAMLLPCTHVVDREDLPPLKCCPECRAPFSKDSPRPNIGIQRASDEARTSAETAALAPSHQLLQCLREAGRLHTYEAQIIEACGGHTRCLQAFELPEGGTHEGSRFAGAESEEIDEVVTRHDAFADVLPVPAPAAPPAPDRSATALLRAVAAGQPVTWLPTRREWGPAVHMLLEYARGDEPAPATAALEVMRRAVETWGADTANYLRTAFSIHVDSLVARVVGAPGALRDATAALLYVLLTSTSRSSWLSFAHREWRTHCPALVELAADPVDARRDLAIAWLVSANTSGLQPSQHCIYLPVEGAVRVVESLMAYGCANEGRRGDRALELAAILVAPKGGVFLHEHISDAYIAQIRARARDLLNPGARQLAQLYSAGCVLL